MFAVVVGAAALTWYLDKTGPRENTFVNKSGETQKIKNPLRPTELGYGRELATKIPWEAGRATHIGDIDYTVPNPYINILPGGENTAVSDMKQAVLPKQKENFRKLVNLRENVEEYWRFDNHLGSKYPTGNSGTHRHSSIAYRYGY